MSEKTRTALIVFAHGSRDPAWRRPFDRLVDRLASESGADRVRLAFLEFDEPTLGEAIDDVVDDGARLVRVWPLFIAVGAHVRRDLPERIERARRRHPGVAIEAVRAIGEDPRLFETLLEIGRDAADASTPPGPSEDRLDSLPGPG